MTLFVEAVDHHPVVAGQLLEDARAVVAQGLERGCGNDRLDGGLDEAGKIRRRAGVLDLDHEFAAGGAMNERIRRASGLADKAPQGDRDLAQAFG